MRRTILFKRTLPVFGLDLWWDGEIVYAVDNSMRKSRVIDVRRAATFGQAADIMRSLEDEFHRIASAMV